MAAFNLSQMLDRTNPRSRDLTQSELAALEALIDTAGIEAVLQGLSEVCGLKADHIAHNWQDTILAKRWATLEGGRPPSADCRAKAFGSTKSLSAIYGPWREPTLQTIARA